MSARTKCPVYPYAGRRIALLTQHGKEGAIASALDPALGCRVERVDGYDTDQLGTFTRDIPRAGIQIEAARKKVRIGMELSGLPLGLASEGSFGPDPMVGMFPWNVEFLVFIDGGFNSEQRHPDRSARLACPHQPDRSHIILLSEDGQDEPVSYARLAAAARAIAAGLLARGAPPGSRVALMLPTGLDFFAAFYGALYAGCVPVPLYPPARPAQLEEHLRRIAGILANAGALWFVADPRARAAVARSSQRVASMRREARRATKKNWTMAAVAPLALAVARCFDLIVVGTHGRSVWILDDLTPLRALAAEHGASLRIWPVDFGTVFAGSGGLPRRLNLTGAEKAGRRRPTIAVNKAAGKKAIGK